MILNSQPWLEVNGTTTSMPSLAICNDEQLCLQHQNNQQPNPRHENIELMEQDAHEINHDNLPSSNSYFSSTRSTTPLAQYQHMTNKALVSLTTSRPIIMQRWMPPSETSNLIKNRSRLIGILASVGAYILIVMLIVSLIVVLRLGAATEWTFQSPRI